MDSLPAERQRGLLSAGMFIAVLLVLFAYLDFALNIWPLKLAEARWRFGAVAVLTSYAPWLLLGAFMMLWSGQGAARPRALKVVAILCALQGVVLLGCLVGFPLDYLQIRRDVPDTDKWTFQVAAARAVFKLVLSIVSFGWLALAGNRASKDDGAAKPTRRETSPLIVGQERR